MDAKIRRLENNLTTLGTGIIAFGLWSFIKLLLTSLFVGSFNYFNTDEYGAKEATILNLIVWGISVLSLLMYIWLGLSARAEGKGKRVRIVYLFFVGIIIIFSTLVIVLEIALVVLGFMNIDKYITTNSDPITMIITIIIDATRMIFLIELMYSSITLRNLKKKNREEEGNV